MNPAMHLERTSKEYIILSMSLLSAIILFPFMIHRVVTADWLIAIFDAGAMIITASLFAYTYKTRKTEYPCLILSILLVAGEVTTVAIKGVPQLFWAYPCTVGVYYLTTPARAATMNTIAIVTLFLLIFDSVKGTEKAAFILSLVTTNLFTIVFAIRNNIQKKQLEALTLKDPLTGVRNRRACEHYLDEVDTFDNKGDTQDAMILLDVDHFKKINDDHGHLVGDDALVRLVNLLQTQLHSDEKIYRIGGERFAILPINMSLDHSFELADRLRKIIEHSNFNEKLGMTVSAGVASRKEKEAARDWLRRADQALYQAKRAGRNQTRKAA